MKTAETATLPGPKESRLNTAQGSNYRLAEAQFDTLLNTEALDQNLLSLRPIIEGFEQTLGQALVSAYKDSTDSEAAHLFLQRILYRINRLKLFWYDDLQQYYNERASYLQSIRDQIVGKWQAWELKSLDINALKNMNVEETLQKYSERDLETKPSQTGIFFRDQVGEAGYRRLLEITSLDALVEASQLSRMLGGVGNEIHAMLTRLFLEEYGSGRLARKHSTYFEAMLREFGMKIKPEAYFKVVPWEVLAGINHSFLVSERKLYFLRYIGGLLYTEISIPSAFCHYSAAARRLNFSDSSLGYWDIHIKEDERHGQWMLHDIALPLTLRYPRDAWELIFGYEQQRLLSQRAGKAVAQAARQADLNCTETKQTSSS